MSAILSGAFGVETSGSMGIVIGVIVGVIVALALALVIMHRHRREMRRKKAHEPPPLQRPTTEAHEPQPAVATAAPEPNPAPPEKRPITLEISPAEPAVETQSQPVLVPRLPDLELAVATAAPYPTLGQRHAVGSSVYVKRSNGEETLAFEKEYDAEKALYTEEIERVGSEKAKTYRDKDLRASKNMLEGLLYTVRATLFTLQAAQEPEPGEEAAQAAEADRVAAEEASQAAEADRVAEEEAAQAAEADRVQVLEPTVPPTAVRAVDELRSRRSTVIYPRNAVPATVFTSVRDVTTGQESVRQQHQQRHH